ncbi:MAG: hypothetical protein MPW15_19005 [Candidatus Manganitrophus sp.]|nr:hypothetical protein [Candidatus Manganitrophus sp.]
MKSRSSCFSKPGFRTSWYILGVFHPNERPPLLIDRDILADFIFPHRPPVLIDPDDRLFFGRRHQIHFHRRINQMDRAAPRTGERQTVGHHLPGSLGIENIFHQPIGKGVLNGLPFRESLVVSDPSPVGAEIKLRRRGITDGAGIVALTDRPHRVGEGQRRIDLHQKGLNRQLGLDVVSLAIVAVADDSISID